MPRIALSLSRAEWMREILAGVVTSLALIPEVISFAFVSGVDPDSALFASVVLPVVTSLFGGRPAMVSRRRRAPSRSSSDRSRRHW